MSTIEPWQKIGLTVQREADFTDAVCFAPAKSTATIEEMRKIADAELPPGKSIFAGFNSPNPGRATREGASPTST